METQIEALQTAGRALGSRREEEEEEEDHVYMSR